MHPPRLFRSNVFFLSLPPLLFPPLVQNPRPPPFTHLFNDFSDALEGRAVLLVFVVAQRHVVLQVGLVAQISERVAVLGAGRVVGCCFLDWVRLYWGGGQGVHRRRSDRMIGKKTQGHKLQEGN